MVEDAQSTEAKPTENGVHAEEHIPEQSTPPSPTVTVQNGAPLKSPVDTDAQGLVIDSLRSQIQDLYSQVTQLNGQLVRSYNRVSDLEDELHGSETTVQRQTQKISQLESERSQHLLALNTGLLVEKDNVTAELTRLMEKATEEAAQRGQAETARNAIEKDLDDLSATLFDQANTMVAEARFARFQSEQKVEETEMLLREKDEEVREMRKQMGVMLSERQNAERRAYGLRLTMSKGKWVERAGGTGPPTIKLLSSHLPYQDFLLFVAHLRSLHPASPQQTPTMSTLLPLPFVARLLTEDSDPTLRLDLAPSLNWLSRRSVLSAIHTGHLSIEAMSAQWLLQEARQPSPGTTVPGLNSLGNNLACALCGSVVFPVQEVVSPTGVVRPPLHPSQQSGAWSSTAALFKRPSISSISGDPPASPSRSASIASSEYPSQVFVFRVSLTPVSTSSPTSFSFPNLPPPSHPINHTLPPTSPTPTTYYPLCTNGWCQRRLRITCTLWTFIREGIVDKIWEEEVPNLTPVPPVPPPATIPQATTNGAPPPVPPRRRGLWGMASALTEKAADRAKKALTAPPTPPPKAPAATLGRLGASSTPPPLPKRAETRGRSVTPLARKGIPDFDAPPLGSEKEKVNANDQAEPPPHRIPLPESRPATPTTPAPPTQSHSETAPSPMPAVVAPTPVPAAAAPPPPIPRRAAARGPANGSAPGTPNLGGTAPSPVIPDASTTPKPQAVENVHSEEVETKEDVAATAVSGSESAMVAEMEASKDSDNNDTEAVGEKNGVDNSNEKEAATEDAIATPTPSPSGVRPTSNGDTLLFDADGHHPGGGDKGHLPPNSAPLLSDEEAASEEMGMHMEVSEENKDVNDKEVYVGETTWEERTWKEVIRIREEMFWARIGGVRS